jgi:hypothetical protein
VVACKCSGHLSARKPSICEVRRTSHGLENEYHGQMAESVFQPARFLNNSSTTSFRDDKSSIALLPVESRNSSISPHPRPLFALAKDVKILKGRRRGLWRRTWLLEILWCLAGFFCLGGWSSIFPHFVCGPDMLILPSHCPRAGSP